MLSYISNGSKRHGTALGVCEEMKKYTKQIHKHKQEREKIALRYGTVRYGTVRYGTTIDDGS